MTGNPRLAASFRDPSGFLFSRDGVLYRQINKIYHAEYQTLMESGLYKTLQDNDLLIQHDEVPISPAEPSIAYKVIQPQPLQFISYPYEWCFSQLKDAALTTLTIQKHALNYNMSLKDSSAYNIQFHRGRPVLIDTLSFEAYTEGEPWVAYRQFCQHFLAPLSLMALRDVRLSQLMRVYIDGIPLDLTSRLLPSRTRINPALLPHIHMHAASQKRFADTDISTSTTKRKMSRTSFLGLIDSLESGVRKLQWKLEETEWGDYYQAGQNYSPEAQKVKQQLVAQYLDQIQPSSVWDLGANIGLFSRLASDRSVPSIAFDIDPSAVEQNYRTCKSEKATHLLPLLLDLTNPSPSLGWHNRERMSLLERGPADAILALALVHHLAISNNIPLSMLARFLSQMGAWLIVEFVPKSDTQVQRLLTSRQDIFTDYTPSGFEHAFKEYFTFREKEKVYDSERILYLMEGREENI